jgi:ABC-type lipoprotein release transport system permease subunit
MFYFAWRNLWRNPARTRSIIVVIALALFATALIRSQYLGSAEYMTQTVVNQMIGKIQILPQKTEKLVLDIHLLNTIQSHHPEILSLVPRLESKVWISGKKSWNSATVLGIDIYREEKMMQFSKKIIQGRYFKNRQEKAILIAEKLAQKLSLKTGDSLIISESQKSVPQYFHIAGIVKVAPQESWQNLLIMPLEASRDLLKTDGEISNICVDFGQDADIQNIKSILNQYFHSSIHRIQTWEQALPDLFDLLSLYAIAGWILSFVLYILMAMGVVGMLVLGLEERKTEFKMLAKIGMNTNQFYLITLIEHCLLILLGIILAIIFLSPVLYYLHLRPIVLHSDIADALVNLGFSPNLHFSFSVSVLKLPLIMMGLVGIILLFINYPILKQYNIPKTKN